MRRRRVLVYCIIVFFVDVLDQAKYVSPPTLGHDSDTVSSSFKSHQSIIRGDQRFGNECHHARLVADLVYWIAVDGSLVGASERYPWFRYFLLDRLPDTVLQQCKSTTIPQAHR